MPTSSCALFGPLKSHVESLLVPFGDKAYVRQKMSDKVGVIVRQLKKTSNRLRRISCQNLYALLVQCLNAKIQFWMQFMQPEVLMPQCDISTMRYCKSQGLLQVNPLPGNAKTSNHSPALAQTSPRWDVAFSVRRGTCGIPGGHMSVCAFLHGVDGLVRHVVPGPTGSHARPIRQRQFRRRQRKDDVPHSHRKWLRTRQ